MSEANLDCQDSPLRIKWEVPLPWLIGGIVLICFQSAVVYFGQIRQGELILDQSAKIAELSKKLGEVSTLIGTNNVKDVEHDLKLADHERRLQIAEMRSVRNAITGEMTQQRGRN
jgi:hypothetical protein